MDLFLSKKKTEVFYSSVKMGYSAFFFLRRNNAPAHTRVQRSSAMGIRSIEADPVCGISN